MAGFNPVTAAVGIAEPITALERCCPLYRGLQFCGPQEGGSYERGGW